MQIHGIGELILRIREERNLSQKELAYGLCGQQRLSYIEMGIDLPDTFLLEVLMSRLGKSADMLEYTISEEEYYLYAMRDTIEEALDQEQYGRVEEQLKEYEEYLLEKDILHFQYVDMIRAFLAWEGKGKEKEVITLLEAAMDKTMPFWREENIWSYAMSWLEAGLFLLWNERTKPQKERKRFFEELLDYTERQWTDAEEKVKLYPFTVLLYGRQLIKEKDYRRAEKLCKRAIQLLIKNNSLSNLSELLTLRIAALKELAGEGAEMERLIKQRDALEAVEKEYCYKTPKISIFTKVKKEIYLDREILRKNRKAMGITQEELSEGICSQETLARIERGRKATEKNFRKLTERISWKKEKRANEMACWDYALLEKKKEIDWLASRYRNQEAKEKLLSFPYIDTIEGQQYVKYMLALVELQLKEKEPQEVLELLEEALKMTLGLKDWKKIKDCVLTKQEVLILNGIGIVYAQMGQKEKAIALYEDIMEGYRQSKVAPVFQAYGMLTVLGNMGSFLEECDFYDESLRYRKAKLDLEVKCRRIGGIARVLAGWADILERQEKEEPQRKEMYIQAYYISDLIGDTVAREIIKTHFQEIYGYSIE